MDVLFPNRRTANVADIMALAEEAINSKIKDMPAEEVTTGETQPEGEAQNG